MKSKIMLTACLALTTLAFSACGGSSDNATTTDSTKGNTTLPRPSSNSDATNPSLPDTTIIKTDSLHPRADSVRH